MSIGDVVAVDLPTIIILIVLWLLDFFKIREVEKKVDEVKARVSPR